MIGKPNHKPFWSFHHQSVVGALGLEPRTR